jgi:ketosteroid isomerase-like protein
VRVLLGLLARRRAEVVASPGPDLEGLVTVRASFHAYLSQDAQAAGALLAPDFRFTSPQDDHIDRATYMDRCFPTADRMRSQRLLHVTEADERDVFVMYEYELTGGETYRNAELITVERGRIVEAQVFFGGRYYPSAASSE